MPAYKLKLIEYEKIKNTWELEFDVTDQAKWDELRATVANFDDDILEEFPEEAPTCLCQCSPFEPISCYNNWCL